MSLPPHECKCGERGEGKYQCDVFGHGPLYENTKRLRDEETQGLKPTANRNIAQNDDGLWFWDESGLWAHGPYGTLDQVKLALDAYCRGRAVTVQPEETC